MRKIVAQNFLITFVSKGIGFILAIYLAKILTKEDFGFYASINLILLYLPFLHFGLLNGAGIELPKFINRYSKKRTSHFYITFFISSTAIRIVSGLLIFPLIFLLSSKVQNTPHGSLLFYVFLFFIISKFGENIRLYYLSHLKFQRNNFFRVFTDIFPPFSAFLVFYYLHTLEGIFLGYALASALVFIWAGIFITKLITDSDYRFNHFIPFLRKLYRTGFPIFLTWVIDTLFKSADRYSIMLFYDIVDLANYSFVNTISSVLLLASVSFSMPYGQLLFKHIAVNDIKKAHHTIRKANILIIITCLIGAAIILLCFPLIVKYTGKYGENFNLLWVMLPVHFLMSITSMFAYYFTSTYNAKTLLKYQLIALVLNLCLNALVIIVKLDIIYFAFTTLITVFVYLILVYIFVRRDIRNKMNPNQVLT